MRKSAVGLVTCGVAAALTVSACGSSSKGSSTNGSGSGGSSGITAACKLTNPPKSTAQLPTAPSTPLTASGKVGVILPDTTSSTRYTLYDAPLLTKALKAAGVTPDVQNAGGSTAKYQQIAQAMIGEGVKVLIMDSIDATSGAAVEREASQAGIKVIDYDRVNLGGTAQYYVSFDNENVGVLQGQSLVDCLGSAKDPGVIEMDGGKDTDNNAILFSNGANSVLKPLASKGKLKIISESVVKGWDVNQAAPTFTQALTAAGGKVDAVLAANDDIANAVIGVLKSNGLAGHVVITGQDSGIEGLQNIINGYQSMTVYKNVTYEANAAAELAIALIGGKDPSSVGLTLSNFPDPKSASHKIQALLLPAQVITQANVGDVIKAGSLTKAQVCAGIEAKCTALGIS
jgi:D-xylose transport system substrate-binding protein